ncbi:ubiquitin-associated and SH3 domain-containing protein A isoform X4 [Phacochoerus africanus]|uniref:ubiquitin-associated and SH3 domain-containing protein A isoform X4 n=1 Tax=Phacochoerus africanus TaxID=41426 RepID=UPI001FD92DB8|nr:ubiquitin-associated and SH3 domain-containing protein A isoform X4 [Phacochoerus africanus]
MQVKEAKIQVPRGSEPHPRFPSPLPPHPLTQANWLPRAAQVSATADPRRGVRRTPKPNVEGAPHPRSAKRVLQTGISCKQDISFCQTDHKGLEVSLLSLRLPASPSPALSAPLSLRAGRDGSGGDTALCQGYQQAQGPQLLRASGAPPGHGLPGPHRAQGTGSYGEEDRGGGIRLEYALFLCPTGPLLDKLQEFWRESKRQCAKNRAHEVFPHITLCDFFTCEDQKVECLYEALKRAGDRSLGAFPAAVPLVLHSSVSYLGFFVNDGPADIIREFAVMFATEASVLADCTVKPCTKQLHLTLAHKFYPHHQRTLEQLARAVHPGHSCQWTAALYSRDMRFVHYQTLRVLFQYKPQNVDELTLSPGDHIFVDPTQQEEASEGWVIGISQRTGCRGFLPENYTERASECDTWVKHRTYTFSRALDPGSRKDEASSRRNGEPHAPHTSRSASSLQSLQASILRRGVLVVRHGERVDQVFGKSWLQQCSTPDGKYYRPDLNFPRGLPRRSNGIKDFESDPPLSSCGIFQSRMAGEALLESGTSITSVFTSPALRCVQTAKHILEELKLEKKVKIRVEPGIFEWTKWEAGKTTPTLMTLEELKEANFNVSMDYRGCHPDRGPRLGTGLLHPPAAQAAAPGLCRLRPAGEKGKRPLSSLGQRVGRPRMQGHCSPLSEWRCVLAAQGRRDPAVP